MTNYNFFKLSNHQKRLKLASNSYIKLIQDQYLFEDKRYAMIFIFPFTRG